MSLATSTSNLTNDGSAKRVMNFAAGPSALPLSVLEQVQKELLNWNGTGVSIMEIGHRSSDFAKIIEEAEADLRSLLSIPSNYAVLFMQGGGTGQFAAVPLNLLKSSEEKAEYLVTGGWSKKASQEAEKFAQVSVVFDGSDGGFTHVPEDLSYSADAKYFYFCSNETIHGVEFSDVPVKVTESEGPVLVADMSSNFLSRRINVNDYGVIVAGAQKNAGIAGLVIAIVRKDLLERAGPQVPTALSYSSTAAGKSILNTPPTFAIYVSGLIFKWLLQQGGLASIEQQNIEKSKLFYDFIDSSNGFYVNNVQHKYRSRMNIPIRICTNGTPNKDLEATFVKTAAQAGLTSLGGHQSVGGLRVSLYNATPLFNVETLIQFMKEFYETHKSA
jgi:phosphoserine aminotransferase